jgi:hypothetical protein
LKSDKTVWHELKGLWVVPAVVLSAHDEFRRNGRDDQLPLAEMANPLATQHNFGTALVPDCKPLPVRAGTEKIGSDAYKGQLTHFRSSQARGWTYGIDMV